MGCQVIKCSTPECQVKMKACQMKNGKCPACHARDNIKKVNNLPKP